MESLKKKYTLTFYRRMANTNPDIMKRYKSAVINGMSFKQLVKIYIDNNLKFEEDIGRLLLFKNSEPEVELKINSEPEVELKINSEPEVELKNNSEPEPIQEIELNTIGKYSESINLYNSILLSNPISKKYPNIKQNSIIYTILNTKSNLTPTIKNKNNIYYSKFISLLESNKLKCISLFESMKEYFLNLR